MKNKKILVLFPAFLALIPLVSCGSQPSVDPTKTLLTLYCNGGGYGSTWLQNAGNRFIELTKDISFEEGKKGVQIVYNVDKINSGIQNIANFNSETNDIYFTENINYNSFVGATNPFLDLTDLLNETNTYDGKKIIDKFYDSHINYLTRGGKIYAIPHYPGYYGFTYSIEIFDTLNCYLDADGEICKVSKKAKGLGPNGKTGIIDGVDYSYDDGLPATYDEFFYMCDYIKQKGYQPLQLTGKYANQHLNGLFRTLASDADGAEVVKMKSSFDGELDAVKLNADGEPVVITDPETGDVIDVETEKATVRNEDGQRHDLYRSKGVYYAASFLKKLCKLPKSEGSVDDDFTQIAAQQQYIYSNTPLATLDKEGNQCNYAMLVDGPWWESEGRDCFDKAVKRLGDEKYSRQNRKFGWLPLPKPNKDLVGQKNCIQDCLESYVVARNSKDENRNKLVKEFLRFVNSDAELKNFALDTGVKRNLKYSLDTTELSSCSTYTKSLIYYMSDCDVCYPAIQNDYVLSNFKEFTTFDSLNSYCSAVVSGNTYGAGYAFWKNPSLTPEAYFKSYYSAKKSR